MQRVNPGHHSLRPIAAGNPNLDSDDLTVVPTVVSFTYFKLQWRIIPFLVGSIWTKGALEFRCYSWDPIFLFFVMGVVVVGAGVEASSEAW